MRSIFLEHYILDTAGFVIDRKGNILDNYINKQGEVYVKVNDYRYYFKGLIDGYTEPVYKNIKLMKRSGLWKTFVVSSGKFIDNSSFKDKDTAALWVNELYVTNNLDRVPNAVPVNHGEFK